MEPLARAKVDPDGAIDENCRQRQPMFGKALFCHARAPRRCRKDGNILTCQLIDGSYVLRGWHKVRSPERAVQIGGQQPDHGFSMSKYLSDGRNSGVPQYTEGKALRWVGRAVSSPQRSKLLHVAPSDDHRRLERRIKELRTSLAKYETGALQLDPEAMADLTKAVHDIGDHLMELSERIDRIEDNREEWTTRGWSPAPGGESDADV